MNLPASCRTPVNPNPKAIQQVTHSMQNLEIKFIQKKFIQQLYLVDVKNVNLPSVPVV
jgi:hypothetical protein